MQTIPATKDEYYSNNPIKRVAIFARVSTNHNEQITSISSQYEVLLNMIQNKPFWEFYKLYKEEGKSGTNIAHRSTFQQMLNDAENHLFDIILVKSISRFSRNTLDLLVTIRKLKEIGVEVFFAEENLSSFNPNTELMLSIYSSLAQEESHDLSDIIKWGIKRKMEKGEFTLPYARFLGYKKGPNGRPAIVKSEARIIKRIYGMYLRGVSIHHIAAILTKRHISTPSRKDKWSYATVKSILTNEKYKGDALLQKTCVLDFLNHRSVKNDNIATKYYVQNSHPAIIDPKTWYEVQSRIASQEKSKNMNT